MSYAAAHRRLEWALVLAHLALSVLVAARIVCRAGPLDALVAVALLAPALLTADFFSGLVHWLADRFGSLETPLLGKHVLRSFREHHRDPAAMTRHDFITTSGDTCLMTVPALALVLATVRGDGPGGRAGLSFALLVLTLVFATGHIHKWAHARRPPRLVAWLQRRGLLLAPAAHARHHRPPFDRAYFITTGWCNGPFDRLRVFARLEALIRACTYRSPSPKRRP
jgi:ubiquitin-conjugating enzyme E2 variant